MIDVNADYMATFSVLDNPTLYPSAYMVLTRKGYTKHYYAGTERVAARIGGGGLNSLCDVAVYNRKMAATASLLFNQSLDQVNNRALQENDLECIMYNDFATEEFKQEIDGIPYRMQANIEIYNDEFEGMINAMIDDTNDGREEEVYFYHSDHLGSASWITDGGGDAVQHLQYLPYGERYVDQRMSGYNERFTFTGKEKDEETGLGYFGARYIDHELMTMWLSVDPMADKYPSISPYAYCAWNPVKLVDPDGREIDVSGLSEAMQQRLVNCLGKITGLYLNVENGLLIYSGKDPNSTSFSQSAQEDLLAAIGNKGIKVAVQESDDYDDTQGGDWASIGNHSIYISSSFHAGNEDYDAKTEGLGMSFLHELGHAYFGDNDPDPEPYSFIERTFDKRQPYPCYGTDLGEAVTRVNKYRAEMGMSTRASYESYNYRKGEPESWKKFEGQVAFREGKSIVYKTMK